MVLLLVKSYRPYKMSDALKAGMKTFLCCSTKRMASLVFEVRTTWSFKERMATLKFPLEIHMTKSWKDIWRAQVPPIVKKPSLEGCSQCSYK